MALSKPVRKWLRYSLDDLKIARAIESMGSSYWRGCAYHSQQAVEKAIKGYLTFHQVRITKTHDLALLTDAVRVVDPALAKLLLRAKNLTKFAVEYRYPDAANRPMTHAKAKSALTTAENIYQAIADRLQLGSR